MMMVIFYKFVVGWLMVLNGNNGSMVIVNMVMVELSVMVVGSYVDCGSDTGSGDDRNGDGYGTDGVSVGDCGYW